ncbi:MAG: hypothetical protein KDB03_26370 [Planctomycetales bacterium]|nr:hypothetical protein [Planctomycetales bacterium]
MAGMAELAASRWEDQIEKWPAEFAFIRDYARMYFTAVCRQYSPSSKNWISVQPPETIVLESRLQSTPPMLGRTACPVDGHMLATDPFSICKLKQGRSQPW